MFVVVFQLSPVQIMVLSSVLPTSHRPAMGSAVGVVGLHSLRQLCWWRPDCLLGVVWDAQRHSDVIVELSMQLDPKAHTAEFVQW